MSISLQRLMRYPEETSMFKYRGDNIGKRNTHPAKLRDVARGVKRRALLGHSGHAPPPEIFLLNYAIWCVLVYIWIRFCH